MRTGRYGELRLSKAGRTRLEGYYVDQIWGVGANLVDELVLWSPLLLSTEPRPSVSCISGSGVGKTWQVTVAAKHDDSVADDAPSSDRSSSSSTASNATIVPKPLVTGPNPGIVTTNK